MRFHARVMPLVYLLCMLLTSVQARGQTPALTANVASTDEPSGKISLQIVFDGKPPGRNQSGVVVWLEPGVSAPGRLLGDYVLTQKNKQFSPHLLVVPVGSSVDFPNEDPFFHNVFSLFNGRRFDLGLYQSHTHRAVRFDREGVSYIFCNIHPQMGAVIVSLKTPYYAISSADGTVTITGLPAGVYRLKLWAEDVPVEQLDAASRSLVIATRELIQATIHLNASGDMMKHHANKFGTDYPLASPSTY